MASRDAEIANIKVMARAIGNDQLIELAETLGDLKKATMFQKAEIAEDAILMAVAVLIDHAAKHADHAMQIDQLWEAV